MVCDEDHSYFCMNIPHTVSVKRHILYSTRIIIRFYLYKKQNMYIVLIQIWVRHTPGMAFPDRHESSSWYRHNAGMCTEKLLWSLVASLDYLVVQNQTWLLLCRTESVSFFNTLFIKEFFSLVFLQVYLFRTLFLPFLWKMQGKKGDCSFFWCFAICLFSALLNVSKISWLLGNSPDMQEDFSDP